MEKMIPKERTKNKRLSSIQWGCTIRKLNTNKDIDIKFIGKRKGERETEPLWLKEEEPKKTEFSKILKLKNLDFESSKIQELLSKLKPICFLSTENEKTQELYRNNQYLIDLLCDEIPSLQEFYKEQ